MWSDLIARRLYPWIPKVRRRWKQAAEVGNVHYWSEERIEEYSRKKLTALLRHAAQRTPYYSNMFQERGWDPSCAEKYWPEWPVLTQEQLQEHRDDILSEDADMREMVLDSSGGSSGKTKTFYRSKEASLQSGYGVAYSDGVAGWAPGRRTACLWGAPKDLSENARLSATLMNVLRNTRWYDSFDMSDERMQQYHRDLTYFKPEVIIAYAGSIFQMARFLQRHDLSPNYPVQGIVSSAETLTEEMRLTVDAVFGRKLFNRYGSREVGHIAFECEAHCGMHVSVTGNHVEVMKPGTMEPVCEEEGEILVTTVSQHMFPLIRYEIGDIGILTRTPCQCGRRSHCLAKVLGRSSDFISTAGGRRIHGEYFTHAFYGREKVRQFVLIQDRLDRIAVQMVLSQPLTKQERSEILHEFRLVLGEETQVDLETVDSLSALPSGKRRFTISQLQQ